MTTTPEKRAIEEQCTRWGKCRRKISYSFGWIDRNGNWQDKHMTCDVHAQLSASSQQLRVSMDASAQMSELLFAERKVLAMPGCNFT